MHLIAYGERPSHFVNPYNVSDGDDAEPNIKRGRSNSNEAGQSSSEKKKKQLEIAFGFPLPKIACSIKMKGFLQDVLFLCFDDKAKISVGEPHQPVKASSNPSKKSSIVQVGGKLEAMDHDQNTKCSITPSVTLMVSVPDDPKDSFYRGEASVCVRDTVLEPSHPMRHASDLLKLINLKNPDENENYPSENTDGGNDHRCNLLSVLKSQTK